MPTNTPNMNLIEPIIGADSGLTWEQSVNANADTVDAHNHTSGKGVQIPPSGLDINTSLPFNDNSATSVKAVEFTAQGSLADTQSLYVSGSDLFYNDTAGNVVQITAGGAVNATSSGISSGTATASFVSSVLVVNADTNKPADIQVGSVRLGNNVTGSHFLDLAPPAAMASDFQLTLPSAPGAQSFVTLDASGNFGTPIALSGGITSSNLAANSVGTTQLVNGSVTTAKLASGIVPLQQSQAFTSSGSFTVPAGVTYLNVLGIGGGGGGGSGVYNTTSGAGGGGGSGGVPIAQPIFALPGATLTVSLGTGGVGASYPGVNVTGAAGGAGGTTTIFNGSDSVYQAPGGAGGAGGVLPGNTAGAGGSSTALNPINIYAANGGAGGGPASGGSGGGKNIFSQSTSSNGGGSVALCGGGGGGGGGFNGSYQAPGGTGGTGSGSSAGSGGNAPAGSFGGGGGGCSGGAPSGPNPSPHGGNGSPGYVIFTWVGP